MFSALLPYAFGPMIMLAQLDIDGFLTGPEGRGIAANLISTIIVGMINAFIEIFFGVTL